MDSDYDIFEIATVIREFWLLDSDSYQRKYHTSNAKPLPRGYYVVSWPEHIRARRFNEHAEFHGPFKSRSEAKIASECMQKAWKRVSTIDAAALNRTQILKYLKQTESLNESKASQN